MTVLGIGLALAVALVINILILVLCARRTSTSTPKRKTKCINNTQEMNSDEQHPGVVGQIDGAGDDHRRRITELTLQRCRVRLSSLLQEGTYGKVYRGTYNDTEDVIVKTVSAQASPLQVSLLLQEGMSLYGASHESIHSVLGVSIEDHMAPYLVYSAQMNTRNLKLFLQDNYTMRFSTIQIVRMALQLAQGLEHLHRHGLVHKDVATRNCVINDQLRVQLSDNSLSRDLFPGDYFCLGDSENRPIRWMAVEAIQNNKFSETSDSWAFGVLLWELCTRARQPYAEIDAFEMEQYLTDGFRLTQPTNCPDEL